MERGSYELDNVDREILRILQSDARTSFLEIARSLGVSGGTVHGRFARMREEGLILGSSIKMDYEKLGYTISAFMGVKLLKASDCASLITKLDNLPEVLEVHYTTGVYCLLIKVLAKSMKDLHHILFDRLQSLDEIQSTETFVVLETSKGQY